MTNTIVAPRQANICGPLRGEGPVLFEPGHQAELGAMLQKLVTDVQVRKLLGDAAVSAGQTREYYWTANATRVLDFLGAA